MIDCDQLKENIMASVYREGVWIYLHNMRVPQ